MNDRPDQAERAEDRSRLILPGDPCPHETVYKHGDDIWRCRDCDQPVEGAYLPPDERRTLGICSSFSPCNGVPVRSGLCAKHIKRSEAIWALATTSVSDGTAGANDSALGPETPIINLPSSYAPGDTYSYLSSSSLTVVTWTRDHQGVWLCDDGRRGTVSDDDVRKAQSGDA